MPKKDSRGIVLLTVLFIALLVSMFIGSAIAVSPRTLGLAQTQDTALTAKAAAESGVRYALTRILSDPEWRGTGDGLVVDTPELKVVENDGYVWGYMTTSDGKSSMFRIRFNYEDGSGGADGLDDSSGERIRIPYVSVNNLTKGSATVVPRASESSSKVSDPNVGPYTVPAHAICLLVEGLAGSRLGEFDPASPNPDGTLPSTVIESIFTVGGIDTITEGAVSMSNRDLTLFVDPGQNVDVNSVGPTKALVRSRARVRVHNEGGGQEHYISDGSVYTEDSTLDALYDSGRVTTETEDPANPFYRITWEDVEELESTTHTLKAGTYVWWDDGSLHYYDLDYADYVTWIRDGTNRTNPGTVIFANGSVTGGASLPSSVTIGKGKINISGDVSILPTSSGTTDFTMIPREGAPLGPPPPGGSGSTPGTGSSAPGNMSPQDFARYLAQPQNKLIMRQFFETLQRYHPHYIEGQDGVGSKLEYTGPGTIKITRLSTPGKMKYMWETVGGMGGGTPSSPYNFVWFYNTASEEFQYQHSNHPLLEDAIASGFIGGYVPEQLWRAIADDLEIDEEDVELAEGDLGLGTGDTWTAEDIEIHLTPAEGESLTFTTQGNLRLGTSVIGEQTALISGGTLHLVGVGMDISADPDASIGVSLYARDNITVSTFLPALSSKGELFRDVVFRGVTYTWGDFIAKLADTPNPNIKRGTFSVEGLLVAYGDDPSTDTGEDLTRGRITISAGAITLTFNPGYLLNFFSELPADVRFQRSLWAVH